MNEYKIYHMDDVYWWLARSSEEATASMKEELEYDDLDMPDDAPIELVESDLLELKIGEEDSDVKRTFLEQLNLYKAKGIPQPTMFASTEY